MNKAELIKKIADNAGISKADAERALDGFVAAIKEELNAGGEVPVPGLGKFTRGKTKDRQGRNPQTGEPLDIKGKFVGKFKEGKALGDALNASA